MMHKVYSFNAWLNEHPDRMRAVAVAVAAALTLIALVVPEAAALAEPIATSGSG